MTHAWPFVAAAFVLGVCVGLALGIWIEHNAEPVPVPTVITAVPDTAAPDTATATATATHTAPPTNTASPTRTATATASQTATATPTATDVPTATRTPVRTPSSPTATPFFTSTPEVVRRPLSWWVAEFDSRAAYERAKWYDTWAASNNSQWYYFLGYAVDGYTAIYRATGQRAYLEQALTYIERVIADARPSSALTGSQFRDSYQGWIGVPFDSTTGLEYVLFESVLWRYVVDALRVIHDDPTLLAVYSDRYAAILAFTEQNMWDKWYNRGTGNIYRTRTHMASHWGYIALNLEALTTSPIRAAQCRTVRTRIDADLRGQLVSDGTAYRWSDQWGQYPPQSVQDMMHANHMVSYIVRAAELGTYWTAADLRLFAGTAWRAWNSDRADPRWMVNVDGSGGVDKYQVQGDGWLKLARVDPALAALYEVYAGLMTEQGPYMTSPLGNGALVARLAE